MLKNSENNLKYAQIDNFYISQKIFQLFFFRQHELNYMFFTKPGVLPTKNITKISSHVWI
jgi:hypothetical protein